MAQPGLFKSLSREGGGKTKKCSRSSLCVRRRGLGNSTAAAPSAGELVQPQGWPLQQPVFKVL